MHSKIGHVNLDGIWYDTALDKYRKEATVEGENLTMECNNTTYQFTFRGNSKIVLNMHGKKLIGELTSTPQINWKDKKGKVLMKWAHEAV